MSERLRWSILGAGSISKQFATGLPLSGSGELVAVGSRDLDRASAFCAEFGGEPTTYDEAISRDDVDAVYIALPHHLHTEWTIRAARAGKAILCEKPFAMNAAAAKEALQVVSETGVFFMEAFMYRCHPQTIAVKRMLNEGLIGKVLSVHGEFGFNAGKPYTNFRGDRELGGGALMDVGCYPISMTLLVADERPAKAMYSMHTAGNGYDSMGAGLLEFPGGLRATFQSAVHANLRNDFTIFGERGRIHLPSPWICSGEIFVHLDGREPERVFEAGPPHLWGNQATVVLQLLEKKQAPFMSHRDTLWVSETLDSLRRSAGLKFGGEA